MSLVLPGVRVKVDMAGEGGQYGARTITSTADTDKVDGTLGTSLHPDLVTEAKKKGIFTCNHKNDVKHIYNLY